MWWCIRALLCVAVPILNLIRVIHKERRLQQLQEAASSEEPSAGVAEPDATNTEEAVAEDTRVDRNPAFTEAED